MEVTCFCDLYAVETGDEWLKVLNGDLLEAAYEGSVNWVCDLWSCKRWRGLVTGQPFIKFKYFCSCFLTQVWCFLRFKNLIKRNILMVLNFVNRIEWRCDINLDEIRRRAIPTSRVILNDERDRADNKFKLFSKFIRCCLIELLIK